MSVFKLGDYLVDKAPSSALYIPDFITESEEQALLKHVYNAPKPKWTQLTNRRLQNWGGLPHAKGMVQEKIPEWLAEYLNRLSLMDVFDGKSPNHVLVNEYLPTQGIMPHLDGPLFYPTIATINLGSDAFIDFYEQAENATSRYMGSFLLEQRSLVCFKDSLYTHYLHGIGETQNENEKHVLNDVTKRVSPRGTRVSLTIRHFPKTLKVRMKLCK